jgi:hypothetical protein
VRLCAPYEFIDRPAVITFDEDILSNKENEMGTTVRMDDSIGRLRGRGEDSNKITEETR